ncbi:MAG: DNA repair protein RadA [Alphaproteobacteria bacterium]|jgi:DNA repair protein RadA/Sms
MARSTSSFVCQDCGAVHRKWTGKCDDCGAWNTIVEEIVEAAVPKGVTAQGGKRIDLVSLDGATEQQPRRLTGIGEFDRVCGGGLVPGSALLVGGDPGIGKSTMLLQATARLSASGHAVVYISGEEAIDQVRMRADRLGLRSAPLSLAAATSVRDILATLDGGDAPDLLVIDSIQTMFVDSLDSAPGTVAQVRSSAQELIRLAKRRGTTVILVGHVTKEGTIAGPKVLEHMVDTVLYFEGERSHQFRILRTVKNRFGPTDEIGVFEMTDGGLAEVSNPSELFLADHSDAVSGTAVFAGLEGTRPVLVEIQALVTPSSLGTPRRAVIGWDSGRLAMVLAVLQARCGLALGGADVYLNVAGGLRITEPAADLAVAAALLSAHSGMLAPASTVIFGEIGLGGEVRAVGQAEARLKEAAKLGFRHAIAPSQNRRKPGRAAAGDSGVAIREMVHVGDLLDLFDSSAAPGGTLAAV